jgi:hypothetical protein
VNFRWISSLVEDESTRPCVGWSEISSVSLEHLSRELWIGGEQSREPAFCFFPEITSFRVRREKNWDPAGDRKVAAAGATREIGGTDKVAPTNRACKQLPSLAGLTHGVGVHSTGALGVSATGSQL